MKKKTRSKSVNSNILFGPPPILAGEELAEKIYEIVAFGRCLLAIESG
jgi:hypothetical protein